MMREKIKHLFGYIRCQMAGIKNVSGEVYIGKNVHIINGNNIRLGSNIQIRPDCDLYAGSKFIIGTNCDIGTRNRIAGEIIIEDAVLFGPDNFICSYDHTFDDVTKPIISQSEHPGNVNGHNELLIGEGSWIGTHCVIIGDVHIGKHCVIGANSVVTRDIPEYSVAVGCPAKVIKRYDFEKQEWRRV